MKKLQWIVLFSMITPQFGYCLGFSHENITEQPQQQQQQDDEPYVPEQYVPNFAPTPLSTPKVNTSTDTPNDIKIDPKSITNIEYYDPNGISQFGKHKCSTPMSCLNAYFDNKDDQIDEEFERNKEESEKEFEKVLNRSKSDDNK